MNLFSQLYWIRRLGSTRRFHGIRFIHDETVLHHSSNVAMIIIQAIENPSASLLKAAIMHDLEEGVTGDIPAPVKWYVDTLGKLETLEIKVRGFYGLRFPDLTVEEIEILKAADFIDAVFTCLMERANGNHEVDWPFENYRLYEERSKLLEHFPQFSWLWLKISEAYQDLKRGEHPNLIDKAQSENFWSYR